jgi:asparagine synthase (glutamine-hydrolysing)
MIKKYLLDHPKISIKSDLAAEFPYYLYLSSDKSYLLYSTSIQELLDYEEVIKPLKIKDESISFLLQSGIVPLPNTVYTNIFSIGIGDEVVVETINKEINLSFSHKFPFKNELRRKEEKIDEDYILELLATATTKHLKKGSDSYLFHSAGKDSNMIALALAEAGYQEKITCLTHKSQGADDESEISKKIAMKLGFKHQTISSPKSIDKVHLDSISYYFENTPLPCVDNVTLAYPLYSTQIDFSNSNIIDGSGNDVYIGHIPSQTEFQKQKHFSRFHRFRNLTNLLTSDNKIRNITLTRSEWAGLSGFSFGDTEKFFTQSNSVYKYWREEDKKREDWDYFDVRADIWGSMVESDRVIRKSRNLATLSHANLILPWCNSDVAAYFSKIPENLLFDRKHLKNKLLLRKILKERIGLDSDKLGKMAFSFDFFSTLMMMKSEVSQNIINCKLWDKQEIQKRLTYLFNTSNYNSKNRTLIQRLYLISAWYNTNKYIKRGK